MTEPLRETSAGQMETHWWVLLVLTWLVWDSVHEYMKYMRIYQLFNMIFLHLVCLITGFMTVRMSTSNRLLCNFKSAHFSLSALWKLVQRPAWQLLPVWWGLCGDGVAWWRPLEWRAMQLPLVIHLQEGRQWVHLILISPNSFNFKLLF